MPEIMSISAGGIMKIQGGYVVGVVHFDVVAHEGMPERLTGYCRAEDCRSMIQGLQRLAQAAQEAENL